MKSLKILPIILTITISFLIFNCSDKDNPLQPRNNAPEGSIVTPIDNATYRFGDTITFTATADDTEDGSLTDSSLVWTSDIDGQIGIGNTITTDSLSSNQHVITLIVTDSEKKVDTTSIQITVVITFEKTFGGENWDRANSLCTTSDGGYVIVGVAVSSATDVYFFKTDSIGTLVWEKTFDGGGSWDEGKSVSETSDGGYIILGYTNSFGAGEADFYLIKTDNSGNLVWEKTFGGISNEWGYSVSETDDGGYIIAGTTESFGAGSRDIYLVKTDNSGNLVWEKTFGGIDNDYGYSIIETTDSNFIITGFINSSGAGLSDIYLIKTDNNGTVIWEKTIGGVSSDIGYSISETSDGSYIIVGSTMSSGAGGADVYLIKTGRNGTIIWEQTFGGGNLDFGYSVGETSDGGYIITGKTRSFGAGEYDLYLIKTDNSGNLVWEKAFGGADDEIGYSVSETSDGGYIITGYTKSFGVGPHNVYLIKTDSEGNVY